MSDELKERNILKLISIVRFARATLEVGHPIVCREVEKGELDCVSERSDEQWVEWPACERLLEGVDTRLTCADPVLEETTFGCC
jgi:hypothetical protein